jgi:hypothetical protein
MTPFFRHRSPCNVRKHATYVSTTLLGVLATVIGLTLTACNDTGWPDRNPVVVDSIGVGALKVWPPLKYALTGDTVAVEVQDLKTLYTCSQLLALNWVVADSGTRLFRTIYASATLPGTPECPLTPGLDTLLYAPVPAAPRRLILRTTRGQVTDSVLAIDGVDSLHSFVHIRSTADTLRTHGRFTFRDSTAGHPTRRLYSDSLRTCEVLQAAVYVRLNQGDTLTITYRTLTATPALPSATFPACTGLHRDTATVVQNRYRFP